MPWSVAVASWSGLVGAVLRPGLVVPGGDAHVAAPAALPVSLAVLQVVWLAAVAWRAQRTHQRMLAALGVLGVAVVLVALASITRVRGPVGDYLTFWPSAVALLNWSVAIGGTIAIVTRSQTTVGGRGRPVARATAVAVVALAAGDGIRALAMAAYDHRAPTATSASQVRDLTDAVEARIRSNGAAHPRFRIESGVWPESAGVVLQLRKRGVPVTVDGDVAFVFSAPPTSQDDAFFVFTDDAGAAATELSAIEVARAGRVVVTEQR